LVIYRFDRWTPSCMVYHIQRLVEFLALRLSSVLFCLSWPRKPCTVPVQWRTRLTNHNDSKFLR
jgi:hypothetical protein